jgi:hypothetical protein
MTFIKKVIKIIYLLAELNVTIAGLMIVAILSLYSMADLKGVDVTNATVDLSSLVGTKSFDWSWIITLIVVVVGGVARTIYYFHKNRKDMSFKKVREWFKTH